MADDMIHTGAMIALVPADPENWALESGQGEDVSDLHVTLCYWEDAESLSPQYKIELHRAAIDAAANFPPIQGEAFGVALFNPGEGQCMVLEITGDDVNAVRQAVAEMVGTGQGYLPWNAHMTLKYGSLDLNEGIDKLGPITFDHIRVAIGEDHVDYPFNGYAEQGEMQMPMDTEPAATESEYASADCGCDTVMASVNSKTWQSLPVAERDTKWSAEEAIARISSWAGSDGDKFAKPFLWKQADGQPLNPDSYRLPVADVVNGKLVLVPRAVFQAATILSGGHGYLEGVVPDDERDELKSVITSMYEKLQEMYQDPRVVAPWLLGRTPAEREEEASNMKASITAAVNRSGWGSMPIADASRPWDSGAARGRLRSWSDGDMRKYRRGFLWWDQAAPENFGSYKLPIADVIDGTLTIVPRAVNSAYGATQGARGGVDIPSSDLSGVRSVLETIRNRFDSGSEDSATASAGPLTPPASWFDNPGLTGPTPLTVTADGRVYGHLAAWGVCHAGISNKCVMAPRSTTGYKYFRNGQVLTADGSMVRVGRLTVGTGHADPYLGYIPAADHYDNTGTAVAVVASGEDRYGIWVAGATVPGVSNEKIAELRRSPLSGDWRRSPEGGLELVAALAVNTPGFPIVKFGADQVQASLLAAGMVLPEGMSAPDPVTYTEADQEMINRVSAIEDRIAQLLKRDRAARLDSIFAKFGG